MEPIRFDLVRFFVRLWLQTTRLQDRTDYKIEQFLIRRNQAERRNLIDKSNICAVIFKFALAWGSKIHRISIYFPHVASTYRSTWGAVLFNGLLFGCSWRREDYNYIKSWFLNWVILGDIKICVIKSYEKVNFRILVWFCGT